MGTEAIVNKDKRRFLIGATSVVGGIGAAAVAVPFVMSLWPSERAKAAGAPIEVDIGKIEPGQKINVEWRGKVCWLVNRTPEMLASLPKLDERVADPKSNVPQQPSYCKNETRSIKPNVFVAVGICTHLGCSPTFRPELAPAAFARSLGQRDITNGTATAAAPMPPTTDVAPMRKRRLSLFTIASVTIPAFRSIPVPALQKLRIIRDLLPCFEARRREDT